MRFTLFLMKQITSNLIYDIDVWLDLLESDTAIGCQDLWVKNRAPGTQESRENSRFWNFNPVWNEKFKIFLSMLRKEST